MVSGQWAQWQVLADLLSRAKESRLLSLISLRFWANRSCSIRARAAAARLLSSTSGVSSPGLRPPFLLLLPLLSGAPSLPCGLSSTETDDRSGDCHAAACATFEEACRAVGIGLRGGGGVPSIPVTAIPRSGSLLAPPPPPPQPPSDGSAPGAIGGSPPPGVPCTPGSLPPVNAAAAPGGVVGEVTSPHPCRAATLLAAHPCLDPPPAGAAAGGLPRELVGVFGRPTGAKRFDDGRLPGAGEARPPRSTAAGAGATVIRVGSISTKMRTLHSLAIMSMVMSPLSASWPAGCMVRRAARLTCAPLLRKLVVPAIRHVSRLPEIFVILIILNF